MGTAHTNNGTETHSPVAPHAREEGFTLLEIMIALVILGSILLGVTLGISTAFAAGRDTQERLEQRLFTSRVVEELRALPWTTLPGFHGYTVEEGNFLATVRVQLVATQLLQVQVETSSSAVTGESTRTTFLVANKQ